MFLKNKQNKTKQNKKQNAKNQGILLYIFFSCHFPVLANHLFEYNDTKIKGKAWQPLVPFPVSPSLLIYLFIFMCFLPYL